MPGPARQLPRFAPLTLRSPVIGYGLGPNIVIFTLIHKLELKKEQCQAVIDLIILLLLSVPDT